MKKILILITLVIVSISAYSQTATIPVKAVNYKDWPANYTLTNTTADTFIFNAQKNYWTTQVYEVNLDSLTGNHTNVAVALYGRIFTTDSWTAIGSAVNWLSGGDESSPDTTIKITNTTPNNYNQFMVRIVGTGTGTTRVDNQQFQLWYTPTAAVYHALNSQSAGTANAITLNFSPDIPALHEGLRVSFIADSANTGAVTIAIDGGTAKAIVEQEGATPNALDANDIRVGTVQDLFYTGTQWIKISPSGN